jgi:chaperonin GroES
MKVSITLVSSSSLLLLALSNFSSAFVITTTSRHTSTGGTSLKQQQYTLDGTEIDGPITPTGNSIWVKVRDTLQATDGGIFLPDEAKERPTQGVVVAAGPGRIHPHTGILIKSPISVGQSVMYGMFDGRSVEYNGEDCQIVRDDSILLTYEGVSMKLESVQPVRDYILVELDEKKDMTTQSGVVVAGQVMKDYAPCQGRVVKVGEGRMAANGQLTGSPVKVGDYVKFRDYAGNEVDIQGKEYSVVKMVNVLCTLVESDEEKEE